MLPRGVVCAALILVIILGVIVGGLYLNSAIYHLWLADGPPGDDPEYHLDAFFRHLGIASISLIATFIASLCLWVRYKIKA